MKILTFLMLLLISIFNNKASATLKDTYCIAYLYGGTTDTYINYIKNTNNSVNTVIVDFFKINKTGNLELNSTLTNEFVNYLHQNNILAIPFISNHWNLEIGKMALANRDYLSYEIQNALETYNLDGINIDIEGLNQEYSSTYTDFLKLLREKIPENKSISSAVAANPNGYKNGWHGFYNYSEINNYTDFIFLMSYDESYEGGNTGPVASKNFVEKSIKYALNYIDKDKIVLGVPFYGRIWDNNCNFNGDGISIRNIDDILNLYECKNENLYGETKTTFNVKNTDKKIKINGKYLKEGSYTIWYETENNLKEKIDLINDYDLYALGIWRLGQETKNIWETLSIYLTDIEFCDISKNWAKDDILYVNKKGWMFGTSNRIFSPNKNLTRAETAVCITRFLKITPKKNLNTFNDTQNHWAKDEINTLNNLGIMIGTGNNNFNPNSPLTRADICIIFYRILNLKEENLEEQFKDVDKTLYAYKEILTLYNNGIIKGYEENTFKPLNPITRAEMSSLLKSSYHYL